MFSHLWRVSGARTQPIAAVFKEENPHAPYYSPVQPHIRQAPVESDHVAGHQVELVYFKELFHFLLVVLGDVNGSAHLARALVAPRDHSCNKVKREEKIDVSAKEKGIVRNDNN